MSTAEDHGETGWDEGYGWGIVDACAACEAVSNPEPNPEPAPTLTPSGMTLLIGLMALSGSVVMRRRK